MALRVLFPRIRIQKLLHLRHTAVRFGAESQLDLDQGFETRVEIGDPEVDELGELGEELFVEGFVGGAREFGVAFGPREFGRVFVGFFDQFFHSCPRGVVIEEFVVALFYAWRERGFKGWVDCSEGGGGEERREREREREKKKERGGGGGRTFVDVRKVGAEARDWFENRLPAESAGRVSYESRKNARPGGKGKQGESRR